MNEIIVTEDPKNPNEMSFKQRQTDLEVQTQEEKELQERKKKSPFRQFYQVNKAHSEDLQWLLKNNVNAYRILLFLFDHMDKYNAVMCSYQVFTEYLEIGRTTASNAVKCLKDHGFIYIYKSGTSNVYVANPDLVWNSWGKNVEYCEFPANIILSASEQEDRVKAKAMKPKKINTIEPKEDLSDK